MIDYTKPQPGYVDLNLILHLDQEHLLPHHALVQAIQPAVDSGTIWRTIHPVMWTAHAGIENGFLKPTSYPPHQS